MTHYTQKKLAYLGLELHPIVDEAGRILFDDTDVQKGFGITAETLANTMTRHRTHFEIGKHFDLISIGEVEKEYWTKRGIVKLAFFIEHTPKAMAFVEFLETLPTLVADAPISKNLIAKRLEEEAAHLLYSDRMLTNLSTNAVHLGLLVDSIVKTLASAGLHSLGTVTSHERPSLDLDTRYLDIIAANLKQMLEQQHAYDLKVLEQQSTQKDREH